MKNVEIELLSVGKTKRLSAPVQVLVEQDRLLQYKHNPQKRTKERQNRMKRLSYYRSSGEEESDVDKT